jgi:hypothetical protein
MWSDALKVYAEKEVVELEVLCAELVVGCPTDCNAFTADDPLDDCRVLVLELNERMIRSTTVACSCSSSTMCMWTIAYHL